MKQLLSWVPRKSRNSSTTNAPSATLLPSTPSSEKAFPSGIKTLHSDESSAIDIIFVHGLTGHREKTWKAKNAIHSWPQTLLPSKIPNARILTFGYDAHVTDWRGVVSKNRIGGHSMNLLAAIATHREDDDTVDRPIIFVCHSLGGLVCEDALSLAQQRPERHLKQVLHATYGIVFLGTPHHGSGLAHWAESLAKVIGLLKQTNPEILAVLKRDSEVLDRVQNSFHTMIRSRGQDGLPPIQITCFYEELPLPGIGTVVPSHSAILPGYIPIGIRSNHMDMTKFEDRDDPGFVAVTGELRRWCKELSSSSPGGARVAAVRQQEPRAPPESASRDITEQIVDAAACDAIISSRKGCNTITVDQDPKFIGREDTIKEIDQRFKAKRRVALCGVGGVGKSQIAIEFSYRLQNQHPHAHIFWVYSSTGSRIYQGYSRIAEELGLPGWNNPDVNIFKLVSRALSSGECGRWLLVLDNVDDMEPFENPEACPSSVGDGPKEPLINYIPRSPEGLILITTRDTSVGRFLTDNEIKIEPMALLEAESLLQSKLTREESLDQAKILELVKALEYLPLAITQAAAYIMNHEISLNEYLNILHKDDEEMSELMYTEEKDPRRDGESQSSIIRTWKISFDKIRETCARAAEILCLMAVLDRQGIPEDLLKRPGESETRFKKSLGKLKAFSLVSATRTEAMLSMHRLVQLATRMWLKLYQEAHRCEEEALKTLSRRFPVWNHENRVTCKILQPHAQAVIQYKFRDDLDMPRANLLHNLALYHQEQGQYSLAFERFSHALLLRTRFVKLEDSIDALMSFHHTAQVLGLQGRYKDAENRHQQALIYRKTLLGQEHPDTLCTMNDLGLVLLRSGKYNAAGDTLQQTLKSQKKVYGPEHPETLKTMSHLALNLYYLGRHKDAAEMDQQTLELRKKVLGPEHPDTLISMGNLAGNLSRLGRLKEAAEMNQQTLELCKKVHGPEHPDTLISMNNIARNLSRLGRYKEAAEMDQQILELCKKILGPEHPNTLMAMNNLAVNLSRLGRYKEAAETDQQIVELRKKVLGSEHPDTLISMNNLAGSLYQLGMHKEAAEINQQIVKIRKKVLRPEHPSTLTSMNNLAGRLSQLGRNKETKELGQLKSSLQEN